MNDKQYGKGNYVFSADKAIFITLSAKLLRKIIIDLI